MEELIASTFSVADHVLVYYGSAVQKNVTWPVFRSKFTGSHTVIVAQHLYYEVLSQSGKRSCSRVHTRRLVLYETIIEDSQATHGTMAVEEIHHRRVQGYSP